MNFLHDTKFIDIMILILSTLGVVTIMFGFVVIMTLLNQMRIRLKQKTLVEYNQLLQPKNLLTTDKQIEVTNNMLIFISKLIEIECNNTMKTNIVLNQKYEFTNATDDIKHISTAVYQGLNPDNVFGNPNILLKDEYIMKYISQQTTIELIGQALRLNEAKRNEMPVASTG
jgi:hypothetical protein